MASEWYYRKGDQKIGPLSASQLKQLADSGTLDPSDSIWKDGLKEWVPARFVNGLFPPLELSMAQSLPAQRPTTPAPPPAATPPAPPPSPSPPVTPTRGGTPLDRLHNDVFNMEDAKPLELGILPAFEEFKSLDYDFLVPYKKIFSVSMLKKKAVRWVLFFGVFPLLVPSLAAQFELTYRTCFWLLGAYFSLLWATYFHGILLPSPQVWRRGLQFAAFTIAIGMPLLLSTHSLPVVKELYASLESRAITARIIGFVFGVGLLEETCKALPLLLFCLRSGARLSLKDTIFLGIMSGLGFALAEGVGYGINRYWAESAIFSAQQIRDVVVELSPPRGQIDFKALDNRLIALVPTLAAKYQDTTLVQIIRFVTLPLLHAAWAGVVGWFVATASHHKQKERAIVILGIFLMAVLHGLYDVFSDGLIGVAIAAISLIIFMGYLVHGQDEAPPTVQQTAI